MRAAPAEIAAAQEVRYRVFYDELGANGARPIQARTGATPTASTRSATICWCSTPRFPAPTTGASSAPTACCGRRRRDQAGGFYSDDEFELNKLIARHPGQRFLELGRSCVLPEYRSKRTIEVLWQGIWAYINHYEVGVMTGCASFHGIVPAAHAEALSFLAQNCRTSSDWDVRAVAGRYCSMDLMPPEAVNMKSALAAMPPLIKGYLRVGARIGDGCVIDHEFGTVDVFIVMPVKEIAARYVNYYGGEAALRGLRLTAALTCPATPCAKTLPQGISSGRRPGRAR